jgi:cyclopropane fatty-acyl-phospholipid synthase-like methyltransferase
MEKIYRDVPLASIPWNLSKPPQLLIDAVESGTIKPCRVIDLGCGAGNYAVWLAGQGFDVIGVDISQQAVSHAEELAVRSGVICRFVAADLLGDLKQFHDGFDLALDWEVLHHVFPEDRPVFIRNVYSLLRSGGRYLSVCFSESDPAFGGKGKVRATPLGTTLYFSNEEELRALFETAFEVLELSTVEIAGKYGAHTANVAWLEKL